MSTDYKQLASQLESLVANPPDELLKDEETRKRLLAAATNLVPQIEQQNDTIQRLMYTPLELVAARIGHDLDLFEKLEKAGRPLTTDEIAKSVDGDAVTLDRLFKFMASISFFKEVGPSEWQASRLTKTLAHPGVKAGTFHNLENCGPTLLAFPKFLKERKYKNTWDGADTAWSFSHDGMGAFQWLGAHPENLQHLGMWMTVQRYGAESWLDNFPFEKTVTEGVSDESRLLFVDVGGGVGHQCQALTSKFPALKGRIVNQDQEQVLKDALPTEGVDNKGLDFFKDQPVQGAKAYYLRNILHDWPDDRCLVILKNVKASMAPDSILLVDEMVVPKTKASKISTQVDLTMLSNFASEERSEPRWHGLLGDAGFKIEEIYTYQKEVGDAVIVASVK